MGDWYYVGHYGQLGPLTLAQIEELVGSGVVGPETYVWRTGMEAWTSAGKAPDLAASFKASQPFSVPPPPPGSAPPVQLPRPDLASLDYYPTQGGLRSDRSRIAAGVLQIFVPGVGRMYLGYVALGIAQLVLAFCGIGAIWSLVDGILMLCGNLKRDGYGRELGA